MDANEQLSAAARCTDQLLLAVPANAANLDPLWNASSDVLAMLIDAGYAPEEFLPDDVAGQLNFTVPGADSARRFFQCYSREVRKSLCGEDGELRKSVRTAMATGTTSLLTTMAAAFTVPMDAVILLAPIAAVLLSKGIDALCSMDTTTTSTTVEKTNQVSETGGTTASVGE